MLGKTVSSPLFGSASCLCFSTLDFTKTTRDIASQNVSFSDRLPAYVMRKALKPSFSPMKWELHSTAQVANIPLNDEDRKALEACREALLAFSFTLEEQDKILGKAFGQIHSPYWGEERKKEVPKFKTVNEILEFLRSLSLSDDDLAKLLKKFPEVLGCNLENDLKTNVQILEKDWGIKGKSLRSLLLRNPKVLGYNVDCKGDCMAKCTRCWVRF